MEWQLPALASRLDHVKAAVMRGVLQSLQAAQGRGGQRERDHVYKWR